MHTAHMAQDMKHVIITEYDCTAIVSC